MIKLRYHQTISVLMLLTLIFSFAGGKFTFKNIDALQTSFNQKICGGCQALECAQTKIKLKNLTNYDFPSNPIENNRYNITEIIFLTNTSKNNFTINGKTYEFLTGYLLAMPILPNISDFKGVIGYFHGTLFNKSASPSNLGAQFRALIALYCSQGFAMVFPDEIGLGVNFKSVHPYVVNPIPNAQSMVIALNYVLAPLQTRYGFDFINLFLAGFSEGGSYSLLFSHCVTKPWDCTGFTEFLSVGYRFKKAAGLQGAYDIAEVVIPFLIEEVTHQDGNKFLIESTILSSLAKPGIAVMAVNSFATYNTTPFTLKSVLNESFFQMACTGPLQTQCNVAEGLHLNISEAFLQKSLNDTRFSMSLAFSAMGKSMNGWKYGSEIAISEGVPKNSILALFTQSLFSSAFYQAAKEASFVGKSFAFVNQTFIFSLKFDSIVSPLNLINLNKGNKYSELIFNNSDYKVCDLLKVEVPVDHLRIQVLANVYALKFFDPTA